MASTIVPATAAPFSIAAQASAGTGMEMLPRSKKFWSCVDVDDISGNDPWGCHMVLTLGFITALYVLWHVCMQ